MRQILQSLDTGTTELADVPCPQVKAGHLLVRTRRSLISVGTERMLVEFGKANLIEKARQQPGKVREVLDKIKTDGLAATLEAVQSKLDTAIPLGYCNVGEVLAVGASVQGFAVGDRVVSNGPHAEVVCVPKNLCARVPDEVEDEAAVFTVLGAIALQGIRLAQPTLGETFVVTGLGLIGQLAVQLLRAHGCRVLGIDLNLGRLELARQSGAETVALPTDPVAAAQLLSRSRGVDGVIVTASTPSSQPVHQAAQMCRKRGRIILVGVTGLELSREDFYQKELTFQVSCSYGPGRYEPLYEEGGQDYPVGFVRWTEQRNFEAVLDMLAAGSLRVGPLISHHFPIEQAPEAYRVLSEQGESLGIVLAYPDAEQRPTEYLRRSTIAIQPREAPARPGAGPVVGVIGAGNYASRTLVPALVKTGARLKRIASSGGISGTHVARKFGFEQTTTDTDALLADPEINAVVIATRHDSHARLVCQALSAGKHVFVEKPLAVDEQQLMQIESTYAAVQTEAGAPILMVGFNRRFAPQVRKIKSVLETASGPKAMVMTVNAGEVPPEHWTQDPEAGGGRIIGEGCHFIDLLRFLAGCRIVSVQARLFSPQPGLTDAASIILGFADGSMGTVHYLTNGHRSYPKERLEVFCAGRVLELDNFRRLRGYGWPGFRGMNLWRQDKGHEACAAGFVEAVRQGCPAAVPFGELMEVTWASLQAAAQS